jgi:DNA-binding XRE family transcriptional regulator
MDLLSYEGTAMKVSNNVRNLRIKRMMSKAELARLAGVSPLTIDRIERGEPCRIETMRKIIRALGFTPADREEVFPHRLSS